MSDLIDREQAKDAIDKYLVGRNLVTDGTMMARIINGSVIDRLPSAQPTFDARDTQYNLPIGTDLISRQQAIDALWAERMKHDEEMERNLETCSFALRADNKARRNRVEEDIEIIRQLPPAQPKLFQPWEVLVAQAVLSQPKMGKWERHYSRPNVYADLFWHCSECGYRSSDNWADKFNFCPHCGAMMEK